MIGQGQFGTVYQLHLDEEDVDVAVKQIAKPDKNTLREIENQSKMEHKHLLTVITHFQVVNAKKKVSQFIVMPLMTQSLEDVINSGEIANVEYPIKQKWMIQMLLGTLYLHQNNIIHRDLKPGNILLDDDLNLYISDFGLSKSIDQSVAKTLVGTQLYMAPEIFESAKYDLKADVYSLGCIWYEILSDQFLLDVIQNSKEYNSEDFYLTGNIIHKLIPKLEFEEWDDFKKQCENMLRAMPAGRPSTKELYDTFKSNISKYQ
uniref:Protein kinase domain-containing protein n=1 Tax=Trepomonas sp. PC1 TaxID=1076344 RepID=A0A146K2P9_9EUKA|eukprot:JAP90728.1 Protein kinase domain-containing protein [Trepomonas sp. PC1]